MSSVVRWSIADGVATVELARPERLNAFDFTMGEQYRDACVAVTQNAEVRAIVVVAQGSAFCAGGDVVSMSTQGVSGEEVTAAAHVIHEGIHALTQAPVPVVASANGAVAGGGIGIMLAADYVVAGSNFRLAGKYADVGLTPDLGVSTLLVHAVGRTRAMAVLLAGVELDARTALDWAAVAEVHDDPDARALELARHWATGPAGAWGQAKRLVREGAERSFSESLDDEAVTIGKAFDTREAQERIGQFAAASAARSQQ